MNKANKQQVPKIRFEGFSQNWEKQKINKIVSINPRESLPELFNYVDLESVKGTTLIESRKEARDTAPSRAQRVAKKNDIFYQMVRPYQKNNYFFEKDHIDYVFSTGYAQLRPVKITGMFLFSKIQTSDFVNKVLVSCTGTSYPAINSSDLGLIDIFYPHELEQTQIGNFFQQLDKLIELQTRAVQSAEKYKKAMLQKMFPQKGEKVPRVRFEGFSEDWHEQKLENLGSFRRGSFPQPYGLAKWYDPNGMPFVQVYDVDDNMLLKPETKQRISTLAQKESVFVPKGILVLTIQGSIGRIAKTQYDSYVDRTLLIFEELNPKIQIDYFKYVIFLLFEIEKSKAPGGTIKTITKKVLSDFVVLFPSLKEQTAIGNFFQKLDQNIEYEKKKLEQYQTMKRAMLQRMFV